MCSSFRRGTRSQEFAFFNTCLLISPGDGIIIVYLLNSGGGLNYTCVVLRSFNLGARNQLGQEHGVLLGLNCGFLIFYIFIFCSMFDENIMIAQVKTLRNLI